MLDILHPLYANYADMKDFPHNQHLEQPNPSEAYGISGVAGGSIVGTDITGATITPSPASLFRPVAQPAQLAYPEDPFYVRADDYITTTAANIHLRQNSIASTASAPVLSPPPNSASPGFPVTPPIHVASGVPGPMGLSSNTGPMFISTASVPGSVDQILLMNPYDNGEHNASLYDPMNHSSMAPSNHSTSAPVGGGVYFPAVLDEHSRLDLHNADDPYADGAHLNHAQPPIQQNYNDFIDASTQQAAMGMFDANVSSSSRAGPLDLTGSASSLSTSMFSSINARAVSPQDVSPGQTPLEPKCVRRASAPGEVGGEAASGPIPASTPFIVNRDEYGIDWIAFEYSKERVKTKYCVRCDIEVVDIGQLPEDFKSENCIYPRATVPAEEYTGNRRKYETECNYIGWCLSFLNPVLRKQRGLIQRAVDSWRNTNADPTYRSRRVRRMSKKQLGMQKDKERQVLTGLTGAKGGRRRSIQNRRRSTENDSNHLE